MPKPTALELSAIDDLDNDAAKLTNGHAGDVPHLCTVVGRLTRMLCVQFREGFVTPGECAGKHGTEKPVVRSFKLGPFSMRGYSQRDIERWIILLLVGAVVLHQFGLIDKNTFRRTKSPVVVEAPAEPRGERIAVGVAK